MKDRLYLLITVDVENPQTPLRKKRHFQNLIDGEIGDNPIGISQIIEILGKFSFHATFFFNVYESAVWGKDVLRNICHKIKLKNCDVQLHTHPIWCFDNNREHMWQYSLEEQIEIIGEGRTLIKEWTSEFPVAHRAGAYGINEDTLKALSVNNIPVDCSMFYSHPNCKIVWTRNRIMEREGTIEIPITGFFKNIYCDFGLFRLKITKGFIKTDIDWCSLDELKYSVQEMKSNGNKIMNLSMHSYSLIKFNQDFPRFEPDYNNINKLESFLKYVGDDKSIEVITLKEFYNRYQKNPDEFKGSDYVPCIESKIPWTQIPKRAFKRIFK